MDAQPFPGLLREALAPNGFACTLEVVAPTVGEDLESGIAPIVELARYVKGEPRISAVAVTDRVKSDHDLDPADLAWRVAQECGKTPLVHWAGKDRDSDGLARSLDRMAGLGLDHVLLVTGDRLKTPPADRVVRYYDSVHAIHQAKRDSPVSFAAAAVSPFKYREEDLLNQYLKLGKKLRAGADLVISQIGFDMEKARELVWFVRRRGFTVPLMAGVLFLTAARGRYIRKVGIPGIVITDDLQAKLQEEEERELGRGQDAALRRLALQIVGLRRIGYAGVHLSGLVGPDRVQRLLDLVDRLGDELPTAVEWATAWKGALTFADGRPVATAPDPAPSLFDGVDPARLPGEGAGAAGPAKPSASEILRFKVLDAIDRVFFAPRSPGAALLGPALGLATRHAGLGRLLVRAERLGKSALVGCQSCGVCRLPYTAYVCPETCPKGLANGPCGGTREGRCELGDRECIHNRKYRLLKAAGRLDDLEEVLIPPVPEEARGTCAWVNHFTRGPADGVLRLRR